MASDEIKDAIVRAAREDGVNPSYALAVAERESTFNPAAKASKTIRGLYQMSGPLRQQYGSGDSQDPYTQAKGWTSFIKDTKAQMAAKAGRDITDSEAYLGHHYGAQRAARTLAMDPGTPTSAVFSPYEMEINPHFGKAGTIGKLNASITDDIDHRQQKFSSYEEAGSAEPKLDLSSFGTLAEPATTSTASASPPSSAPDLSQYGVAA